MKKIFYISIVFLTFTFVSCEKFLEKAPSGSLPTDSAITSIADLNNAVNGVYQELVGQVFSLSGDMFIYGDLKGPDYEFPNNSGWSTPLGVQPVDSKSGHADDFYRIVYTAIGKVNYALEAAKNYTPTTDDQAAYDALTAELHAIRGWMHFQGATYYCKLPTVAGTNMNDANSGLPISDKVTMPGDYTAKRATLNETYNFAIAELEGSLSKLDISKNGGISKYGAEALLARIYLYKGDYSKALEYAVDIIKNSGASLYSIAEYSDVWSQTFTSESLLELAVTETGANGGRQSFGYEASPDGYAEFGFTKAFYDYLQTLTNDVRTDMVSWKVKTGSTATNKGYYTNKYPGQTGSTQPLYINNPKIVRLSEIYLIAAEAKLKGGNATDAQSAEYYINQLRTNRITGYTNVSSVTIDDIITEYRLELQAEGQYFFALVRNNKTFESQYRGTITPDHYSNICAIPDRELFICPDMKQNPGY